MPTWPISDGSLHFDMRGEGETIIATHGLCESSAYWTKSGVADALSDRFRVAAFDMRGHGKTTTTGDPARYDVDSLAADIDVLADHLGLERFHLLGHATGSVISVRYAATRPDRVRSLAVTSAAAATAMISEDPKKNAKFFGNLVRLFEQGDWARIFPRIKSNPWPFLQGIDQHRDRIKLWSQIEDMFCANDPKTLARFVGDFYTDPDPHLDLVARIVCPTLIHIAELDDLMIAPSEQLVQSIEGAEQLVYPAIGHMSAFEAPKKLSADLIDFFRRAAEQS